MNLLPKHAFLLSDKGRPPISVPRQQRQMPDFSAGTELNRLSRCQFFGKSLPKVRLDKAAGLISPNRNATSRQIIEKCSVHYQGARFYRQSGPAAPSN